jgi:hypothetical protein
MLSDQDSQLVVFPSQLRPVYILARRRHHSNAMEEMNRLDKNLVRQSAGMDGDILANNNLIYVRQLIGETVRRPAIFQWLRDHDTKALGGGEKVANLIETEEEWTTRKRRARMVDDIDYRAKDAWRSYQARTGRRSGYTKSRAGATKMPVQGFTPAESQVAIFTR